MSLEVLLKSLNPPPAAPPVVVDFPEKVVQEQMPLQSEFERVIFDFRKENGSFNRVHNPVEYQKIRNDYLRFQQQDVTVFNQDKRAAELEFEYGKTAFLASSLNTTPEAKEAYQKFLSECEAKKESLDRQQKAIEKTERQFQAKLAQFQSSTPPDRRKIALALIDDNQQVLAQTLQTAEIKTLLGFVLVCESQMFVSGHHEADFFYRAVGEQVFRAAFPECFYDNRYVNKSKLSGLLNLSSEKINALVNTEIERQENYELNELQNTKKAA